MLGQGHTWRLLDEAGEVGRHQHPGPENQDSQHMIDQPRGSFPEPKKVRLTNFSGRSPELVLELLSFKGFGQYFQAKAGSGISFGLLPRKLLKNSLSSVWFAGTTPEKCHLFVSVCFEIFGRVCSQFR